MSKVVWNRELTEKAGYLDALDLLRTDEITDKLVIERYRARLKERAKDNELLKQLNLAKQTLVDPEFRASYLRAIEKYKVADGLPADQRDGDNAKSIVDNVDESRKKLLGDANDAHTSQVVAGEQGFYTKNKTMIFIGGGICCLLVVAGGIVAYFVASSGSKPDGTDTTGSGEAVCENHGYD